MTEEIQNNFDNILVPKGLNSMMELSNQDLLTFIQNHTTQNNNTRYQGVHNSNMQTTNDPNFLTNKNETQFFPSQEPSSTTQEQRLESFDHNYNTNELAIPKEPYLFDSQVPFQVTNSNHERFTNKTISILDQSLAFMKEGNNAKAVHKHCGIDTSSQFLKLYQDQNWQDETDPKIITTESERMEPPIQQRNKFNHSRPTQKTNSNNETKSQRQTQGENPRIYTHPQTNILQKKRRHSFTNPVLYG